MTPIARGEVCRQRRRPLERITQLAIHNSRRRGERMRLGLFHVENVNDFNFARFQVIRDERAMTTPPDRFGAHYRGRSRFLGKIDKSGDAVTKLLRLHVIGVATERFVAPGRVLRIGLRFSPSAELWKMFVANAVFT